MKAHALATISSMHSIQRIINFKYSDYVDLSPIPASIEKFSLFLSHIFRNSSSYTITIIVADTTAINVDSLLSDVATMYPPHINTKTRVEPNTADGTLVMKITFSQFS